MPVQQPQPHSIINPVAHGYIYQDTRRANVGAGTDKGGPRL